MQTNLSTSLMSSVAMPPVHLEQGKLAVRLAGFAHMLDVSPSTLRRAMQADPSFPRPFRLLPKGDWLWATDDLKAYVAAKSAQAQAA